ncbi:MAG: glycosyltransferase family 2 protein [Minisyncoccota bacterium]
MDQTVKKENGEIFVSVIMAVYNGDKFLHETIKSILSQSFSNFEYIIVDDASTDNTSKIIKSYNDDRIIYIRNEKNVGQTVSRNIAISKAIGKYIVQTDADDISLQKRIEKQVEFMETNPDISISGTWVRSIGKGKNYVIRHLTDPEEIKVNLLFRTSITHSTLIIRRDFFIEHSLYYREFPDGKVYGEDFELYVRVSRIGKISNLPKILVLYRRHENQVTHSNIEIQYEHVKNIIKDQLIFLTLTPSDADIEIPLMVKKYLFFNDKDFLKKLETFFIKIEEANKKSRFYNPLALHYVCGNTWLEVSTVLSMKYDIYTLFWNGKTRAWIPKNIRTCTKIIKLYLRHLFFFYSN